MASSCCGLRHHITGDNWRRVFQFGSLNSFSFCTHFLHRPTNNHTTTFPDNLLTTFQFFKINTIALQANVSATAQSSRGINKRWLGPEISVSSR